MESSAQVAGGAVLMIKTSPASTHGANLLQQQAKFDAFIEECNRELPTRPSI